MVVGIAFVGTSARMLSIIEIFVDALIAFVIRQVGECEYYPHSLV